ncbi:hypothetical protein NE237_009513 [Protea cynaroides]|uniref:Uncharacterized protein n=1 Tax=Protea cynaroides TaxID=273540 RepID=A0A9Q0R0D3_9MAGN|nr:hypothetical protein NE237_009513 [Protea cynaroides]
MQEGSLSKVDSALALLKKNGGNINSRNMFGLTPLHIATGRNHVPIVRRLLAAGADPDAREQVKQVLSSASSSEKEENGESGEVEGQNSALGLRTEEYSLVQFNVALSGM